MRSEVPNLKILRLKISEVNNNYILAKLEMARKYNSYQKKIWSNIIMSKHNVHNLYYQELNRHLEKGCSLFNDLPTLGVGKFDENFNFIQSKCTCDIPITILEIIHNHLIYYDQDLSDKYWCCPPCKVESKIIEKRLRAMNKEHTFIYLTLSCDHKLRNIPFTKENISKIKEFVEKWFTKIRYIEYDYVVESGSNKDDPHLHIHSLVRLRYPKKQSKNHSRDLKKYWSKFFPESPLLGNDYYSRQVNGKYYLDKKDYFINENKDSHTNFMDLNISGSYNEA